MDITISVSEKAVENIRAMAEENGKAVEDFIEEFVEESFANGQNGNKSAGDEPEREQRPFMRLQGMFSSDKTDTSERMHEILYSEDLDSAEGFSIR